MRQNTMMGRAALLTICAGLAACSAPGSTEKSLNEQAAWASAVGIDRTRPQATAAAADADGKIRLVAGALSPVTPQPAPPPPVIAQLPPPAATPAPASSAAAPVAAPPPAAQAAASAAGPGAAKASPDSERQEILKEILAWRKAWVEGDAASYMSHYESSFQGDLPSRSAWEKQRRERLTGRDIAVKIVDLTARLEAGVAVVEFEQRYTSKKHEDVGTKTMKLRKIDGRWLIVEEKWRKA